jgi:acyl dehydratase
VNEQRWFEDFSVGDGFESPSKTLTDAHFMFFAGMTGDAHPLHYDDEYAKTTKFGRRLAHGLLLTSMTAVGASTLAAAFIGDTIKPPATRSWRSSARAPRDCSRCA